MGGPTAAPALALLREAHWGLFLFAAAYRSLAEVCPPRRNITAPARRDPWPAQRLLRTTYLALNPAVSQARQGGCAALQTPAAAPHRRVLTVPTTPGRFRTLGALLLVRAAVGLAGLCAAGAHHLAHKSRLRLRGTLAARFAVPSGEGDEEEEEEGRWVPTPLQRARVPSARVPAASDSEAHDQVASAPSCALCLRPRRLPAALGCGHVFCWDCADEACVRTVRAAPAMQCGDRWPGAAPWFPTLGRCVP